VGNYLIAPLRNYLTLRRFRLGNYLIVDTWGTDLVRVDDGAGERWSNARAKRHARGVHVKDPFKLRLNAYRVLLTRGRDGTVIFVPPLAELDLTAACLQAFGVKVLHSRD